MMINTKTKIQRKELSKDTKLDFIYIQIKRLLNINYIRSKNISLARAFARVK